MKNSENIPLTESDSENKNYTTFSESEIIEVDPTPETNTPCITPIQLPEYKQLEALTMDMILGAIKFIPFFFSIAGFEPFRAMPGWVQSAFVLVSIPIGAWQQFLINRSIADRDKTLNTLKCYIEALAVGGNDQAKIQAFFKTQKNHNNSLTKYCMNLFTAFDKTITLGGLIQILPLIVSGFVTEMSHTGLSISTLISLGIGLTIALLGKSPLRNPEFQAALDQLERALAQHQSSGRSDKRTSLILN